jgi:hypothetical protein
MGLLDWEEGQEKKEHIRKLEAKANNLLKKKKVRRGKRTKHKRKIPKMSYKQYMGSAYWKKRKLVYWSKFGKTCAICKKKNGVTLHHKRYDVKYGDEPDDALVALCQFHHHEFHLSHELKTNMVKNSNEYVKLAKVTHEQFISTNLDDLSWI